MTVSIIWVFLMVPRVGLHCVSVFFPGHNRLHIDVCVVEYSFTTGHYVAKSLFDISRRC